MYSCNVPVPPSVSKLARGLAAECFEATPRDRHTLVGKRLGEGRPDRLAGRVRSAAAGIDPFEARVAGVECFAEPPVGTGPVAYLRVESPPLVALHRTLCREFEPVGGIEGDEYVPHVTVARGGDAGRLAGRSIEPASWTVDSLSIWAAEYDEPVRRLSLPF